MQLNEHGAKWLDKLNSMYLESDKYRRNFAEYLAYDRLYAYNYPPKIAALIAIRSFLDLYETVKKRRNISVFRGIQLSYESIHNVPLFLNTLSKSYLNISTNDLKKSLGEIINKDRVNSKGDLVDSALVHFATIGFHEDVKSKSVLIFTCDDSSTIKNRVSKYKSAWDFIKKELPKRNLKVPKIKMGAIIFVDDTGKIAEICKVKTLPKDLKLDINSQPKNPAF
ncbi:MAG: hypothetical protein KBD78_15340 [Oligoflexales bacterium]|nr:hypothetical protein [Oligoflexales bacterium]